MHYLLLTVFLSTIMSPLCGTVVSVPKKDINFNFSGKWRAPEGFWAHNVNLLNEFVAPDNVQYAMSTLDLTGELHAGEETCGYEAITGRLSIRNRAQWGVPTSIAQTTAESVKWLDYVEPPHRHYLGKLFFWAREAWLKISLNAIFDNPCLERQTLTFGAFPFELGRGIALGSAYAVGPGVLGFYIDDIVDQFAFGLKLSGDIFKDCLVYDGYFEVVENKANSFSATSEKIYSQVVGRRDNPTRGPGHLNYVVAGRFIITPKIPQGKISLEPYIMYNHAPEQKVELPADSRSSLGTVGFAAEYYGDRLEGGFDIAKNFGHQRVLGLDRNRVDLENREGVVTLVYSKVLATNPEDSSISQQKAVETKSAQKIVNSSAQGVAYNGQPIGTALQGGVDTTLYNALDRFRGCYTNSYNGWMVVGDIGYWVIPRELQLAVTLGAASGDENPNKNLDDPADAEVDGDFKGFIGFQEVYRGKRVESVLFLGRIPRPLSSPSEVILGAFAINDTGFTNIVLAGLGAHWKPGSSQRKLYIRPNILAYWQEHKTKKFSIRDKKTINALASPFLGIEINIFMEFELIKNLNCFGTGAIFFPGSHYKDIRGKPLNREQLAILDALDTTGFVDTAPLLGHNTAYTVNVGLEYRF